MDLRVLHVKAASERTRGARASAASLEMQLRVMQSRLTDEPTSTTGTRITLNGRLSSDHESPVDRHHRGA